MSDNIIFDQYMNGQLTEKQEEAIDAALLKATFAYQEEQEMLKTFAKWRADEEIDNRKRYFLYGLATTFLLVAIGYGSYKLLTHKTEVGKPINTPIIEKPPVPNALPPKEAPLQIAPSVNQPKPIAKVYLKQNIQAVESATVIRQDDTPPQYLAQIEAILEETSMDISETKMGVENIDSLRRTAQSYFKNKDYPKYIATINQLDKAKISTIDSLFIGEAYLHLNDNKSAINYFKKLEISDPDNEKDIRTLHLALAYIRDKQLDNARKTLKTIVNSKRSNFRVIAKKLLADLK